MFRPKRPPRCGREVSVWPAPLSIPAGKRAAIGPGAGAEVDVALVRHGVAIGRAV
jgi:hypothetical protein